MTDTPKTMVLEVRDVLTMIELMAQQPIREVEVSFTRGNLTFTVRVKK